MGDPKLKPDIEVLNARKNRFYESAGEELYSLAEQTIFPEYGTTSLQSLFCSFPLDSLDEATGQFDQARKIYRTKEEYESEQYGFRAAKVLAERERCAQIAERCSSEEVTNDAQGACLDVAAEIRKGV